jgi:RNA polymerase sigma factor (sigma-70 family)
LIEADPSPARTDPHAFSAFAVELRPELHRYCARLTGSAFDGEDVVQDALERAFASLQTLHSPPPLRPWLFRIAHNRAIDLMRGRAVRVVEPLDAATERPDPDATAVDEKLMRQQAVTTAIARFTELPTTQRSSVILKDVLDHSLAEIADLLDLSIDAVKAHLARGSANLRAINRRATAPEPRRPPSAAALRNAALFKAGDWDGLRARSWLTTSGSSLPHGPTAPASPTSASTSPSTAGCATSVPSPPGRKAAKSSRSSMAPPPRATPS